MVIADEYGRCVDVNQSATELFGVPKDELLGRSITEFAPDGYDSEAGWHEFRTSERERGTLPLVQENGTERVVEYAAIMEIGPGQHLSVLREVTE